MLRKRLPRSGLMHLVTLALVLCGAVSAARAAGGAAVHRIAVLVGANQAAAGRQALRYAYRDADKMARVLGQVGGFEPANIHLLREPEPAVVLALLDRELARLRAEKNGGAQPESLLFFFFSGHADQEAVYTRGQPLALHALRDRLDDPAATVRIGFIDACRGGGWTRAKGLTAAAPFEISLPEPGLSNEGAAFLASSSGLENAHESEALKGSFFTHHFAAGLLGAADQTGDGAVSLTEAFDYAKQLTVRDTAAFAGTPQHPSFDFKLRGRQDLTLTQVMASRSVVQIEATQGPLEIIHLQSGLVVAEIPAGKHELRIALPAGKYLVRRTQQQGIAARELEVEIGRPQLLRERDLRPLGRAQLSVKSWRPGTREAQVPYATASTVEGGIVELREAIGVRYRDFAYSGIGLATGTERSLAFILTGVWGITDRLEWAIGTGALAYRFGSRGRTEWIPWGGLTSWGLRYNADSGTTFSYGLGLGLDLRAWLTEGQSLYFGASVSSEGAKGVVDVSPLTWHTRLAVGYGLTIRRLVSLNFSVAFDQNLLAAGKLASPGYDSPELDWTLRFGAVQSLGLRPLPLVQINVNRWLTIDGYVGVAVKLRDRSMQEHYMLGTTVSIF